LGVGEEIGELAAARNPADALDAIGDVMVYLCDYAGREGFRLADHYGSRPRRKNCLPLFFDLPAAYGMLLHTTLKHHQGIRGLGDRSAYVLARNDNVAELLAAVIRFCTHEGWDPIDILKTTWETVVAKRNWKTDPEGIGE
jgi:hypothetical protein